MKKRIAFLVLAAFLCLAMAAHADIRIDADHFPDPSFAIEVSSFDGNRDGFLNDEELAEITEWYVVNGSIRDMTGIKYFTSLKILVCTDRPLETLDVSRNTALEELDVADCKLTGLNVSGCASLKKLYCSGNRLSALDVRNCTRLEELVCDSNRLSELDISRNTKLWDLQCNNNRLAKLNVKNNPELIQIACSYNLIEKLDVRKNTKLQSFLCYHNKLTELDLSKNKELKRLYCFANQIVSLNVRKCTVLCSIVEIHTRKECRNCADNYLHDCFSCGNEDLHVDRTTAVTGNKVSYPTVLLTEVAKDGGIYTLNEEKKSASLKRLADSKLQALTIPAAVSANGKSYKVTSVADGACKGAERLATVAVGRNVKTIGKNAFKSCKNLTTVSGMSAVTAIHDAAFRYCTSLKEFPWPEELKTIGDYAFQKSRLSSFTFGIQVKKIGKMAFERCTKLKNLTFLTAQLTVDTVGEKAFASTNARAKVICPKAKLKDYRKLLRKRGINSNVEFVSQ